MLVRRCRGSDAFLFWTKNLSTSSSLTTKSFSSCIDLLFATASTCLWPVRKHRARNVDFLDGGGILGPSESIKGRTGSRSGTILQP